MESKKVIKEPDVVETKTQQGNEMMPSMNISVPASRQAGDISTLVDDDQLVGIYDEITNTLRQDREEIDELLNNFSNMVFNEGDASNASKEAVVSLMKLKTDTADKMSKVADLMTRLKMKERDTMAGWQKSQYNQTNHLTIQTDKRDFIEKMQKEDRERNKKEK
jgi:hypothetical protein